MKLNRTPLLLLLGAFFFGGVALADLDPVVSFGIQRIPVQSSNVASVGYSRQLHVLEIEFLWGAVYQYFDVQPRLFRQLLAAPSKGRFVAANLRGKYRFVRVQPRGEVLRPGAGVPAGSR